MIFRTLTFMARTGQKVTIEIYRALLRKPDGHLPASPKEWLDVVGNDEGYIRENHPDILEDYQLAAARRDKKYVVVDSHSNTGSEWWEDTQEGSIKFNLGKWRSKAHKK